MKGVKEIGLHLLSAKVGMLFPKASHDPASRRITFSIDIYKKTTLPVLHLRAQIKQVLVYPLLF